MNDDGIIGTRLKINGIQWLAIDRSETVVRLVTEDGRHGMMISVADFRKSKQVYEKNRLMATKRTAKIDDVA